MRKGSAMIPLLHVAALAGCRLSLASKDTDYYPGYSNPNVDNEMYWKDAINVLQDLNQFESLYIKYHNCVWSEYGNGAVEHENGCSGDGDGDKWYMGRTQCFRANAAFSLYGVLKDESSKSNTYDSSNCNLHTYINSFFTNYGIESFAGPLGLDTYQANSKCTSTSNSASDGEYHGNTHLEKKYDGYTSTTTACTSDGAFVIDKFQGAYCDGAEYVEEVYNLADFNDALAQQKCVQVYNSNDGQNSIAPQILEKSVACSIREYPRACPDPFGLLRKYTTALETVSVKGTASSADVAMNTLPWISLGFVVVAITMFFVTYRMHRNESKKEDQFGLGPPKKHESVPILKQLSNVSNVVAFRAAASMQNAKEKFQNYAEEEEVLITVAEDDKEKQPDLVERGYHAPTPTSSSDESATGKEKEAIKKEQIPALAITEPALADWCDDSESKSKEQQVSAVKKAKSDDWCIPVEEPKPKAEEAIKTAASDLPILRTVSSVTTAQHDRYGLAAPKSSMKDDASSVKSSIKSEGNVEQQKAIMTASLPPVQESPVAESNKKTDPVATVKASSLKETKIPLNATTKGATAKESAKSPAVKEPANISAPKQTTKGSVVKQPTKSSASKASTVSDKTISKASSTAPTKSTVKTSTAPTKSSAVKRTTTPSKSTGASAKIPTKASSSAKPVSATSAARKTGAYTKLSEDKKSSSSAGTAGKTATVTTRKKKRPRMAKLSKALFGEKNK